MYTLEERLAISLAANIWEKLRPGHVTNAAVINLDEAIEKHPRIRQEYAIREYIKVRNAFEGGGDAQ